MKISEYVAKKIEQLEKGYVFTYSDMLRQPEEKEAVIKALNRMVVSGKLAKLGKGRYYKAEETIFGNLEPELFQVVKDLLEENNIIIGYLTGYSIYNKLGLTTQISNTIQIGKNEIRSSIKRGRYTISFIKQKNEISKDNIPLLQILDSIRYIKEIPDTTPYASFERLISLIESIEESNIDKMITLSLKYPASTRALMGLMLETLGKKTIDKLKNTLNPVTIYKMPYISNFITESINWNIK